VLSTGQKFMRLPERVAKQRLKRTLKLAIFGCAIGKTVTPNYSCVRFASCIMVREVAHFPEATPDQRENYKRV
jgi:hypothetical protein